MCELLPQDVQAKIMSFVSHPTADMINNVIDGHYQAHRFARNAVALAPMQKEQYIEWIRQRFPCVYFYFGAWDGIDSENGDEDDEVDEYYYQ